MATYIISRHKGTLDWLIKQGFEVHNHFAHLDPAIIHPGDIVIGTLPIQLAAQVCEQKARYIHLEVNVPYELRGQELSTEKLDELGATLSEFSVKRIS